MVWSDGLSSRESQAQLAVAVGEILPVLGDLGELGGEFLQEGNRLAPWFLGKVKLT